MENKVRATKEESEMSTAAPFETQKGCGSRVGHLSGKPTYREPEVRAIKLLFRRD
jgi:hypothetical protein